MRLFRSKALSSSGLTVFLMGSLMAMPAMAGNGVPDPGVGFSTELAANNVVERMAPGWNLGNTLEAIGPAAADYTSSQETAWGNPAATRKLMRAVKEAGFNSVRLPIAWNQYVDSDGIISPRWMKRVTEVVDDAHDAGLYVVINIHWDGGWMQPTYPYQEPVNSLINSYWTQIAENFRNHDQRLLFAGTNEVMVKDVYTAPTSENCAVQNGFNQAFVDAVRATGGNNANRFLVVQGYNTNIDFTVDCNEKMPADRVADRLMMEVHYYDPFNFTLNTSGPIWQWGEIATDPKVTETWANEAFTDAQFKKMKTHFVNKGIPVILGEYSASLRNEHDQDGKYRNYWNQYITQSAVKHGMVPMYWDTGYLDNHQSGLFNRHKATQGYPETIRQIVEAARNGQSQARD